VLSISIRLSLKKINLQCVTLIEYIVKSIAENRQTMDVKNFFHKILSGNKNTHIPAIVKESFTRKFEDPLNTEWNKAGECFEAMFYKDEMEHIARYTAQGELTCLKINLPLDSLPAIITQTASTHGELMNAISISCETAPKFELIIRDAELNRYYLLLSAEGEVIEKEKL